MPEASSEDAGVSTFTGVPCDQPHHWQVIHKSEITLEEFSLSVVEIKANSICTAAFEELFSSNVNSNNQEINDYANSDGTVLHPLEASWGQGDRTVDCLIGSYTEFYTGSLLD
jgi:hypothetical protein